MAAAQSHSPGHSLQEPKLKELIVKCSATWSSSNSVYSIFDEIPAQSLFATANETRAAFKASCDELVNYALSGNMEAL
jgi:hypothetical protein